MGAAGRPRRPAGADRGRADGRAREGRVGAVPPPLQAALQGLVAALVGVTAIAGISSGLNPLSVGVLVFGAMAGVECVAAVAGAVDSWHRGTAASARLAALTAGPTPAKTHTDAPPARPSTNGSRTRSGRDPCHSPVSASRIPAGRASFVTCLSTCLATTGSSSPARVARADDAVESAASLPGARCRVHSPRWCRPGVAGGSRSAPDRGRRHPGCPPLRRHDRRQHTPRPARRHGGGCGPRDSRRPDQ